MSVKRKFSLNTFRTIVQIICFIFLPVLYASTFSGIRSIYLDFINHTFNVNNSLPILIQVLTIIFITTLAGRLFCGFMCSFGAASDWIYAIAHRFLKKRIRIPEKVDKVLKVLKYGYLLLLVFILWNMDLTFLDSMNPWNAFGTLFSLKGLPDIKAALQYYFFGTILLGSIFIVSAFIERFFCRYMCPLGAIFSITSNLKIFKIKKIREHCGSCRACTNNCPMGISMYEQNKINSGECIMCMRCTQVCPRSNATLSLANNNVNTVIASTIAVSALVTSSYVVDQVSSNRLGNNMISYASTTSGQYKDGTYEGAGTGFHGGTTKVSVTVESGNITDIEVISYQDDEPYFNRAGSTVIGEIINTQSTDVDAVSGATYSSYGIIEAVEDALSITPSTIDDNNQNSDNSNDDFGEGRDKSGFGGGHGFHNRFDSDDGASLNEENSNITSNDSNNNTDNNESFNNSDSSGINSDSSSINSDSNDMNSDSNEPVSYSDGTYEGSGTGFRNRTTTVSVTVKGGEIHNIEIVSTGDDAPFFNRAFSTLSSEIIEKQSSDLDAVSGATYSSLGIMEAVKNALLNA